MTVKAALESWSGDVKAPWATLLQELEDKSMVWSDASSYVWVSAVMLRRLVRNVRAVTNNNEQIDLIRHLLFFAGRERK